MDVVPLIAGNWKMNGLSAALAEVEKLKAMLADRSALDPVVVICPPATLLPRVSDLLSKSGVLTGGQDCHHAMSGPYTGDISAEMLAEAGATFVIVGHSERRVAYGETNATVSAKALAAKAVGLTPIICVGETLQQRETGAAMAVVEEQLVGSVHTSVHPVIAYEPVWAIGTGLTPTSADIETMHAHIRRHLISRLGRRGAAVRILYGGSLKPGNAREILAIPNVNGGLVGGASLLADDFHAIISAV